MRQDVTSRNTAFICRVKSTDTYSESVAQMSYTDWHSAQPDFTSQAESCIQLWSGYSNGQNVITLVLEADP